MTNLNPVDAMTNDYRAMCAELVDELEDWIAYGDALAIEKAHNLVDRARALLDQPVAEEPTDETPWEINDDDLLLFSPANAMAFQAQKRSRRAQDQ